MEFEIKNAEFRQKTAQEVRIRSDSLIKCLTIFNMPFTFFKGMLDVVLCFLIYKPLSPLLHK